MTPIENQLLLDVLAIETHSCEEHAMIAFLLSFFEQHGIEAFRDEIGNVYAVKGEIAEGQKYPLTVAHTDTVHPIHGRKIIPTPVMMPNYDEEVKPALQGFDMDGNRVGLGADDKVGIALSLMLFLRQPVLKGFFPVQEEIGANGAALYNPNFIENVGYAIEFDSPGNEASIMLGNQLMFNPLDPNGLGKVWEEVMIYFAAKEGAMFTYRKHSYTDIVKLRHLFSCCNVPVGYYLYHTDEEYVILEECVRALHMGEELIKRLGYAHYNDAPHDNVRELIELFTWNFVTY